MLRRRPPRDRCQARPVSLRRRRARARAAPRRRHDPASAPVDAAERLLRARGIRPRVHRRVRTSVVALSVRARLSRHADRGGPRLPDVLPHRDRARPRAVLPDGAGGRGDRTRSEDRRHHRGGALRGRRRRPAARRRPGRSVASARRDPGAFESASVAEGTLAPRSVQSQTFVTCSDPPRPSVEQGLGVNMAPQNPLGKLAEPRPPDGLESTLDLLRLAKAGDRGALERLLARSVPALRRWASGRLPRWTRDLMDTDDLVQETVLRTVNRINDFEPRHEGALLAYLRKAVMNRIRDEVGRK